MKKLIFIFLLLSCSKSPNTFDSYINYPVSFSTQNINYPNNDFSIRIPSSWEWEIEKYEDERSILGIDAVSPVDKEGYIDVISVQKFRSYSGSTDLEIEGSHLLKSLLNGQNGLSLIDSGLTRFVSQDVYFFHLKSDTNNYGDIELISIILESGAEGEFYNLTGSASQTNDLIKNQAIIIQCLNTFQTATI